MRWFLAAAMLALAVLPSRAANDDPLDPAGASAAVRRAVFRAEAAHAGADTEAAVHLLTEALAGGADRDHPALRFRLGAYLLELGNASAALPHLARAGEQAPESEAVWLDYARAAYETAAYETAARGFARAYELQGTVHDHADQADADHGHHEADGRVAYYGAVAWILADRPERALEVLETLVEAAPDTVPRSWVQALVSAAAAAGSPERSNAGVLRLLDDHAGSDTAWILASRQAQLRGDQATAATRLQVAGWLASLDSAETRRLADLYAAAGIPRMAARCYARLWPDDPGVARPLAAAWLRSHEPDSSRMVITAALAAAPDAAMWSMLGHVEYEAERWREAHRAYAEVTALNPESGQGWFMQGVCSMKIGDTAAARSALRTAMVFAESAEQAVRLLDYLEASTGRPDFVEARENPMAERGFSKESGPEANR